jgi:hypothetical protein
MNKKELKGRVDAGEWNDSILVLSTTDEVIKAGGAATLEMYCQKAHWDNEDDTVQLYGYVHPTETAWCSWHRIRPDRVTRVVH